MDEKVYEFESGRNGWLRTVIGIDGDEVVIKNEIGRLSLSPESVSELITGLEEARRELDRKID